LTSQIGCGTLKRPMERSTDIEIPAQMRMFVVTITILPF
jgi:hypothetical protein